MLVTRKIFIIVTAITVLAALAALQWFPRSSEPGYRHLMTFGEGVLNEPIGIALAGGEILVSDAGRNQILVFDPEGNIVRSFGQEGRGPGELSRPMLMDIAGGKLYVAEYVNDRVQVFSLDGKALGAVGSSGSGPGEFDSPGGVAVDGRGRLYVADFFNHRVQVLEPDGTFIRQVGETGKKGIRAGLFNYPTDVAVMPDGNIAVADAYNDRVQVFSPDGTFLRKWRGPFALDIHGPFNGWFSVATAVSVGPQGNLFVADFYNHLIQEVHSRGEISRLYRSRGERSGRV